MAKAISYTPPAIPDTAASDELADLVRALHESGLLRALAGAARSYPELLQRALEAVDADSLRAVIALGGALKDLDPDEAERLAGGIRRARADAVDFSAQTPGLLTLLRRLGDEDTRRGLSAVLAALRAIGAALPRR